MGPLQAERVNTPRGRLPHYREGASGPRESEPEFIPTGVVGQMREQYSPGITPNASTQHRYSARASCRFHTYTQAPSQGERDTPAGPLREKCTAIEGCCLIGSALDSTSASAGSDEVRAVPRRTRDTPRASQRRPAYAHTNFTIFRSP